MLHPLQITTTLADKTRFQIYEYMLKHKQQFTVQMIADTFYIHPNVARLHLTKLADIGLISADFEKTGKEGRPGRVYQASNDGVKLSFPKRDDSLLLQILLPLIETFGDMAYEKGKELAYSLGTKHMQNILTSVNKPISFIEKCDILTTQSSLIGYIPKIAETNGRKTVCFTIYNCPFHDHLISHHKTVCMLHEAYLRGQINQLFGKNELIQTDHMMHHCANCQYEIQL